MALRGRASVGKRSVLPNLSLAGKREEKTTPLLPKTRKSASKENRSGKGRGRSAQGSKERPSLIETSGIFSEGLSGTDPTRRSRSARNDQSEPSISILPRVKEEPEDVPDVQKAQSTYSGYEELWGSDDEEDVEELSELLRDGFISDIKHATVLPHVLPIELESQFIDLLHKDVKQDVLDQEQDMKMEVDLDIKNRILREGGEEQEMDDGESPTSKRSRKAARIIRSMMKGSSEDELFMIQLPSVLKLLCQEKSPEEKVIFSSYHSNGDSKLIDIQAMEGNPLLNSHERTTVEKLPPGRSIGKLVVNKAGRVFLRIGGHSMDVAHTTSEGQHQGVIMVETNPRQRDGLAIENGAPRFSGWPGNDDAKNAVYYIGHVRHHLTASLDWKPLRPIGIENSSSTASDALLLPTEKPKSVEMERIRQELSDLQQQISIDVAAALNRWNA